jgi:N-acetyl-anhydromuramyl-L-alanine amidase AmpD
MGITQGSPLKWRNIGYHYGIERVKDHYEILVGRMMDDTGAHCKEQSMNMTSLGICLIGDFDENPPPPGQWVAAVLLVRSLCNLFNIPRERIFAHRDFATYKSCPGDMFDMERFRIQV